MCVCVCVHVRTCVCACGHVYVRMYACVSVYVVYIRTYVCDVHSKLDHQVKYLTSEFSFHPPLKKVFEFEGVSI